ncbi:hypothetical protein ACZ90_03565 [Streptomyces albus subsp. albus]|nr:hypothetical protein ACZ90_03565 [Streptomyces albus subsp. albus]
MTDLTCEQLRAVDAELALGVLPGQERARAVAHLDRCPECRAHIEQLTLVGDGLLGLLPGSEPPVGFETRVAERLAGTGATRAFARRQRRLRLRIAAAGAALALAFGFGGWAVGTGTDSPGTSATRTVQPDQMLLRADLTAAGHTVGRIFAYPGTPGWVYMSVDLDHPGPVSCRLVHADGTTVPVGSIPLHQGYGHWGGPAPVDPHTLSGARLLATDGTVLATARFTESNAAPVR